MKSVLALTVCLLLAVYVAAQEELLSNPDLELDQFHKGSGGWYCNACQGSWSSHAFSGSHSVSVTKRHADWSGLTQKVNLLPNRNYFFKSRVKLLNTHADAMYGKLTVLAKLYSHKAVVKHLLVSELRFVEADEWVVVGGDFTTLPGVDAVEVSVRASQVDVNYLLDAASLQEIPTLPSDWRTRANATIHSIRKSDITIRVAGAKGAMKDLTVTVNQLNHEFGFGSCVNARIFNNAQDKAYRDFFFKNFEWGVLENQLKWKLAEKTEGHPDYSDAMKAIDALLKQNIKLRAHNVFWDVENNVPTWQTGIKGQALKKQMERHIQNIVPMTRGKVQHWDVNNENIHGHFYELATGDANVTNWMFQQIHKLDPHVKLFLNDFAVVNSAHSTQAFYNEAIKMKNMSSVPLYGLGIQSHLRLPIDLSLLKYRLHELVATGLPLWITELDIHETDADHKAQLLQDVLTLYFSTPQVHGVMLWGFWDGKMAAPTAALATGPNVTPNAAGQMWIQLVKHDWMTSHEERSLATGSATVRGFRGEYSLQFKNKGVTIHEEKVVVDTGSSTVTATLAGLGDSNRLARPLIVPGVVDQEIQLPEKPLHPDYSPLQQVPDNDGNGKPS